MYNVNAQMVKGPDKYNHGIYHFSEAMLKPSL